MYGMLLMDYWKTKGKEKREKRNEKKKKMGN
jgi:hypothetical protein